MIPLGLSITNLRTLVSLLSTHHFINIKVQILTTSHAYVYDVSKRLVEGQVDIDMLAEVTRSLKVTLLDPFHALHLDSDSPNDGALYYDRMVRVVYNVHNPTGTFSVDIPLFCGPIRKLDRNGVMLNVECQGKEVLALPTAWQARTYRKGMRKTSLAYSLLYEAGERKLDIPTRTPTIPTDVAVGTSTSRWLLAKSTMASMGYQLFYDGRGVARARPWPQIASYTFTENAIKTKPQIGYDLSTVINAVQVISTPPKGSLGSNIRITRVAPLSHPLAPARIGRNGVSLYLPKIIQNNNIKAFSDATALADRELAAGLIASVTVAFDSLPIPLNEEGDVCRLDTEDVSTPFRLTKMSIPLHAGGSATVGYNRRITPNRNAIRLRRR